MTHVVSVSGSAPIIRMLESEWRPTRLAAEGARTHTHRRRAEERAKEMHTAQEERNRDLLARACVLMMI